MRLHSPSQLRIDPGDLGPVEATFPELLAPLARGIHNGKCPACGASVYGVLDGTRVQINCFGDPPHVFFFETSSGHIDNQPTAMGTLNTAQ
ncbi:MAG TPA: hypothetical protein VIN56_10555 [Candidatus Dormibacteraeota bacterium]|jgi:hypothetical protein